MEWTSSNIYVNLISLFVALVCVILAYMKWKQTFWQRKGVYARATSLIFGNSSDVIFQRHCLGEDFERCYQHLKSKGLRFGGYYSFTKPIFIPIDLDLIRTMMVRDFAHFTDHGVHCDEKTDPLTGSLFSLSGQKWRFMRMKLSPTFTSGKMKMMFQILLDCAKDLTEHMDDLIDQKLPVDIKDVGGKFTTDIIMSTAFGLEGNCLKNPDAEYRKYGMKFFANGFYDVLVRFLTFQCPELLYFFKLSSIPTDVSHFFRRVARQTVEYRERNNIIRKDFMHLLIQLKNNVVVNENDVGSLTGDQKTKNESITMDQLMAQAWVFFIAGFETSSSTITFCMYELGRNLQYQEQLRTEINDVLKEFDGKVSHEALQKMTFMDQCINETLRLYPIVAVHTRVCTKDYQVPDTTITIPKGCSVMIPVLGIQRDPDFYPHPLRFDPKRFSEEDCANRHPAAWTPFGDGPRICIGMRFGMMQTKLALVTLLKNYKFTFHSKTEVPLQFGPGSFLLTIKGDFLLNAERIY